MIFGSFPSAAIPTVAAAPTHRMTTADSIAVLLMENPLRVGVLPEISSLTDTMPGDFMSPSFLALPPCPRLQEARGERHDQEAGDEGDHPVPPRQVIRGAARGDPRRASKIIEKDIQGVSPAAARKELPVQVPDRRGVDDEKARAGARQPRAYPDDGGGKQREHRDGEHGGTDRHRLPVPETVPHAARRGADRHADEVRKVEQRDEMGRQAERRPREAERQVVEDGEEGPAGECAREEEPQQVPARKQRGEPGFLLAGFGRFFPPRQPAGRVERRQEQQDGSGDESVPPVQRGVDEPRQQAPPSPPATVAETYDPIATFSRSGGSRRARKTTRHVVMAGTASPWRNLAATSRGKLSVAAHRNPQRDATVPPARRIGRSGNRSARRPRGRVARAIPKITAETDSDAFAAPIPNSRPRTGRTGWVR